MHRLINLHATALHDTYIFILLPRIPFFHSKIKLVRYNKIPQIANNIIRMFQKQRRQYETVYQLFTFILKLAFTDETLIRRNRYSLYYIG